MSRGQDCIDLAGNPSYGRSPNTCFAVHEETLNLTPIKSKKDFIKLFGEKSVRYVEAILVLVIFVILILNNFNTKYKFSICAKNVSSFAELQKIKLEDKKITSTNVIPPSRVYLKINNSQVVNDSMEFDMKNSEKSYFIKCVATECSPPPKFRWYLGNSKLNDKAFKYTFNKRSKEKGDYASILEFTPHIDDMNKALKCKVSHPGYKNQYIAMATLSPA